MTGWRVLGLSALADSWTRSFPSRHNCLLLQELKELVDFCISEEGFVDVSNVTTAGVYGHSAVELVLIQSWIILSCKCCFVGKRYSSTATPNYL